MAHRHKMHEKKASGGGVAPKKDANKEEYDAQGSNVMKEAKEKKHGGKVDGKKGKHRFDKKARGGSVKASGHDMTKSPFSSAHVSGHMGAASNPSAHAHGGKVGK